MEKQDQSNITLKNQKIYQAKLQNYQIKVSLLDSVIRIFVKNTTDKSKFQGSFRLDQFSQTIKNIFQNIEEVYQQILQALEANQKSSQKRVIIDDQNNFVFEYKVLKKFVKQVLPMQEIMKPMLQKQIDDLKKINLKLQSNFDLSQKRISAIQKMLQLNKYQNQKRETQKGFFSKLINYQFKKKVPEINYNIPQENQIYLRNQIKKVEEKIIQKIGTQVQFNHKEILKQAQNLIKEQGKQIQKNLMKTLAQIKVLQKQQNDQLGWIKQIFADNIQQLGQSINFKKQQLLECKLVVFNQYFDTSHPHFNKFEIINNNTIKLIAKEQFDSKSIHITSPRKITDKFNNFSVKKLSSCSSNLIFGFGSQALKSNNVNQYLNPNFVGFSYDGCIYNQVLKRGMSWNDQNRCKTTQNYQSKDKQRYQRQKIYSNIIYSAKNASIYMNLKRRQITLSFDGTEVQTISISERLASKDLYPVIIMYNNNSNYYNPNYNKNKNSKLNQMIVEMNYF